MRISDWSSDVCSSDLPLSLTEILDAVNEGRELGYFVTKGTATPGAGVIALPIGNLADGPLLAIAIGAPIDRIEKERSEERRVGKECVSTCRSRWSPEH